MREGNNCIKAIAEFRREHPGDGFLIIALARGAGEAESGPCQILCPGIGRHDQDGVAELDRLAIVVGELAVIHHLQEDVEEVGMRLLDLVEQQHRVRMLVDGVGEEPALVEAHIARGRAEEPRDRVALHVLRHVEAGDLDPHGARELARDLGLADARGP